ncbi:hypothetical protein [uncultured Aeromicrobium sp.]|uniref:hypothetical protein n=1 Tax=uncultured Aeromicrobium sp. TaxID=337820 RepID=UPI0025D61143|nr:hypothetical protein [uncultured Aeromicrobium sp.]
MSERSDLPGHFESTRIAAGEEYRPTRAGQQFAFWALPEDVDRGSVRCTDDGETLELADPATTEIDGQSAVLLIDATFTALDRVSCTGGGIDEIAVSMRVAESTARTIIIGALVATPVLFVVGLVLRRRGFRWPI